MKLHRTNVGWAVKAWVIASVFVLPFLALWQAITWLCVGAALGLAWRRAPEGPPEKPVEKLPFQDQYAGREIPRRDENQGQTPVSDR